MGAGTRSGRVMAGMIVVVVGVVACSSRPQNTAGPSSTEVSGAGSATSSARPHAKPSRDQTGGLGKARSNIDAGAGDGSTRAGKRSTPTSAPVSGGSDELRQWADTASATSNYGPSEGDPWNASQATGAPDVDPNCGDVDKAWASKEKDTVDILTLGYPVAVIPSEIRVFQTYNPGQVVKLEVKGPSGQSTVIYEGAPTASDACPVEGYIQNLDVGFPVDTVLVTIDQSKLGIGWAEIDAVELVGQPATSDG